MHGLIPIFTLIATEVIISSISLKSITFRHVLSGTPSIVIENGIVNITAIKKLRMSLDDIFEDLRQAGVFDLRTVRFAQIETNGQLSVMLNTADAPSTPKVQGAAPSPENPFFVVISDGNLITENLSSVHKDDSWIEEMLKVNGINSMSQVFLMCGDVSGNVILQKKE